MRRKSERTASKTSKGSPEKKVEKEPPKRTRSRRGKKQCTSSENESADEGTPVRQPDTVESEVKEPPPATPAKEPSPEDAPDQVWQVKSAQGSGDTGEIQKLKICLKRPPSTPERVDRSPRSKRKHARATSSSDTPSLDGSEEKKKKHKSRRATRESKDEGSEKQSDSQTDEPEKEQEEIQAKESGKPENEISQSTEQTNASTSDDTPMSTSTEEVKPEQSGQSTEKKESKSETGSEEKDKQSDADTTVSSPKQVEDKQSDDNLSQEQAAQGRDEDSPVQVIEIQTSPEQDTDKQEESKQESENEPRTEEQSADTKVSKPEENKSKKAAESPQGKTHTTNENDVVERDNDKVRKMSTDSAKDKDTEVSHKTYSQVLEHSESTQLTQEESTFNGQAFTPIVVNRKRRWGARPKVTTQKSITISTDVLKDIIPDVKPVEFDEVIEEKKHHKRVEMSERIERPVLPKIVIDNTESIEPKREREEKENIKSKEGLPLSNRKISIVKDTDDIMLRPLSPPRHKQSCVLYISNLVRPFTLPQLKNLLQRTGRIVEDGFWIDKIKSRCFVIYENEDQAVETRHALHGVQWPPSNPKLLQVDFSSQEAFDKAKANEDVENAPASAIPGTVEDWLREQDLKRERGELDKPWDRKPVREWDVGKGDKTKDEKLPRDPRDERSLDKRRHRTPERSPEPARKFKKKEEEAPAKLLDDLFRKTKTTPCIYWLPLSAETIAVKEEQRRQHMAEHERRISELRRHRERRH